jgi:alpha-L-arabinofuranosidase
VENDYKFKYWELGNEIDLETGQGNETGMDAETYQKRVQQYADVLRSVDPNIVIVAGVPGAGHDIGNSNWTGGNGNMSRYLEAAVAAGSDSLSYHWYQNCNSYEDLEAVTVWEWELEPGTDDIADPYQNWRHMYSRVWSRIGPERVQNEVIPAAAL